MKLSANIGTATLAAFAVTTLAITSIGYAQERGEARGEEDRYASGLTRLIGRDKMTPQDERWVPAAMAVVSDPEAGSAKRKGSKWIHQTVRKTAADQTTWFHQTIHTALTAGARPLEMRALTPAELVAIKAVFANADLSRSRGLTLTSSGITGQSTNRDLGLTSAQLDQLILSSAREMAAAAKAAGG